METVHSHNAEVKINAPSHREAPWLVSYEEWIERKRADNTHLLRSTIQHTKIGSALLVTTLILFLYALMQTSLQGSMLSFGAFCLSLALVVSNAQNVVLTEKWDSFKDMEEISWTMERWLVDLNIIDEGCVIGSDRGILWVEDSRLCFSGHRTSFAITRDDVSDQTAIFQFHNPLATPIFHEHSLLLNDKGKLGKRVISIGYTRECRGFSPYKLSELKHAIHGFEQSKKTNQNGQLPPSSIGPGVISPRLILVLAMLEAVLIAFYSLIILMVVVMATSGGKTGSLWLALVGPLFTIPYAFTKGRLSKLIKAYLSLRKLRALERNG